MAICGKHRGVVVDNLDPMGIGRVRVDVPDIGGGGWALPSVPFAGPGVGFLALPPVGAQIWVEFEAGDPDKPIWSGCFWDPGQAPGADPGVKLIKTSGITLTFDDGTGGFMLEVGPPASPATMKLQLKNGIVEIDNGLGATIVISGAVVDVNNGALTVA